MGGLLTALGAATSATPWGALFGGVFGFGKKWLDNRHEEKMITAANAERALDRQHDLALIDKEIQKETTIAEMELKETMFRADTIALTSTAKSQDTEISALSVVLEKCGKYLRAFAGFVFVCVTAVQKLTRPGLTFSLFCLTCYFYYEVNKMVGGPAAIPRDMLLGIHSRIILSGLSMTELAITFWFVARPGKR